MSPAHPGDESPPTNGSLYRHTTVDGTTYWGDVSEERFQAAAERFPVLRYTVEAYFGSPERKARDREFLARYDQEGEEATEFNGLIDDLTDAIRHYPTAAPLINGLMGADLPPTEIRTLLADLKDQMLHQGAYAEVEDTRTSKDDPLLVSSAPDRVQASFMWRREIPIGPLKGRPQPLLYYFLAGVALFIFGLLVTMIPVDLIQDLGKVIIVVGIIICFIFAVGIISIRNAYIRAQNQSDEPDAPDDIEPQEAKPKRGVFSRLNPFGN